MWLTFYSAGVNYQKNDLDQVKEEKNGYSYRIYV